MLNSSSRTLLIRCCRTSGISGKLSSSSSALIRTFLLSWRNSSWTVHSHSVRPTPLICPSSKKSQGSSRPRTLRGICRRLPTARAARGHRLPTARAARGRNCLNRSSSYCRSTRILRPTRRCRRRWCAWCIRRRRHLYRRCRRRRRRWCCVSIFFVVSVSRREASSV